MSPAKGEHMQKPVSTFKKKTFKNLFSSGRLRHYVCIWLSCLRTSSNQLNQLHPLFYELARQKRKTMKKIPFDIASIRTFLCFSSSYTGTLVVRETWQGCPCLHETGPTRMSQRTKSVEREGFSFVFVKYQHRNLLVSRKRYLFMTVFLRNEHEGYQVTYGTPKRERKYH